MKKEEVYDKLLYNIFGEIFETTYEKKAEIFSAVDTVLAQLPEKDRKHLLGVISGKDPEDEKYRVTLRKLRHPVRSKPIRDKLTPW